MMRGRSQRAMTPAWWSLLVVGMVVTAGAVVWLGAHNDSDGAPLIENPGGVIVALIGAVATILAIVLPQVLAIKNEVQNSHDKPMRDDLDDKHNVIFRALEGLASDVRGMRRDIGRNTDRLDYTVERLDKTIDRIDRIEDTQTSGKEPS